MTEAKPTTEKKTRKPAAKKTAAKKPAAKKTTTRKPVSLELPVNPLAFEVFDLVSRQRTKAKKIEALKKHEHISLSKLYSSGTLMRPSSLLYLMALSLMLVTMSRQYTTVHSTTRSMRQLARCMRTVASP